MTVWLNLIETPQEIRTLTPDQKDLIFLSGYPVLAFKTTGDEITRDDIQIPIGPIWEKIEAVVPSLSLASISNEGTIGKALWAVDNCRWSMHNDRILLQSTLAVRNVNVFLLRLAYHVTAIGKLV
jgi:hypothetical protein